MTGSRRRIVVLIACAGLLLAGGVALVLRERIVERWWIKQLEHADQETRLRAVARLGELQSVRAIPPLLKAAKEDTDLRRPVGDVVARTVKRAPAAVQEQYMAFLADGLSDIEPNVVWECEYLKTAVATLDVGPEYVVTHWAGETDSERRLSIDAFGYVAYGFVEAWRRDREGVSELAAKMSAKGLYDLLQAVEWYFRSLRFAGANPAKGLPPDFDTSVVRELAVYLARHHVDAEARAVALATALRPMADSPDALKEYDRDLLQQVIDGDQESIARRAALRILGRIGSGGTSRLDLPGYEGSPLMVDAIEARRCWSMKFDKAPYVDLSASLAMSCVTRIPVHFAPTPWAIEELEWLAGLLQREEDQTVRDRVAAVFALRARDMKEQCSDLSVREFCVFTEDLLPPVPSHLRPYSVDVSSAEPPTAVASTIYVDTPMPVSLDLAVSFAGGRARSTYPMVTEFESRRSPSSEHSDERHRQRVKPWQMERPRQYQSPSWVWSRKTLDMMGPNCTTAVWSGLRAGYPAALEPALSVMDGASTWQARRSVPAQPVSLRGVTERFVHYDGIVAAQSPLVVAWADAARQSLTLRHRSPRFYPETDWVASAIVADVDSSSALNAIVVHVTQDGSVRGGKIRLAPKVDEPLRVPLEELSLSNEELQRTLRDWIDLPETQLNALLPRWETKWFSTPGTRVVTVLPRWVIDAVLPIEVAPRPGVLVRTGLAVTECDESTPVGISTERWAEINSRPGKTQNWYYDESGVDLPRRLNVSNAHSVAVESATLQWTDTGLALIELVKDEQGIQHVRVSKPTRDDSTFRVSLGPFGTDVDLSCIHLDSKMRTLVLEVLEADRRRIWLVDVAAQTFAELAGADSERVARHPVADSCSTSETRTADAGDSLW